MLYVFLQIDQIYRVLILLVLACIPVYGAGFYLKARVKARKEAIVRELPDVMDLLVVSVEAGLGLDAAIVRQYSKNKNTVLTELSSAIREVQMGVSRKVALKEMADRCDVKQLTAFVTSLLQADQLGVSVKSVLETQAERLRTERKQSIQAKAAKAPIKIMLPTVGFIFPVIFIISVVRRNESDRNVSLRSACMKKVLILANGRPIANAWLANHYLRDCALLGRTLSEGGGLLLAPCNCIHTLGMHMKSTQSTWIEPEPCCA